MRLFDEDMDLDEMEGRPLIEKILLVSGKMMIVIGIGLMLFLEDSIIPQIGNQKKGKAEQAAADEEATKYQGETKERK